MLTLKATGICCVLATLALASTTANAGTFYGNLAEPPGVYFGSGNVNGNWSISTTNGIELGLRAKNRQTGALLDGSTGTYFADPGTYPGGGTKAQWNYEFSVNIGSHSFTEGLTFMLGIDRDPSAGVDFTWVNAQTYWLDNATVANGFQNSQNVGFAGTPGGAFDVNQNGLYSFVLEARNANGVFLDTEMNVQVGAVPEPEAYALMLAGLGVVGFAARRRSSR